MNCITPSVSCLMFHASCFMFHASCLTQGWYSYMYDYSPRFCLTPSGFCSYLSYAGTVAIHVPCSSTLAFRRCWRPIFLLLSRSYGNASSTFQTLSAACRWSCFILVRSTQFLELYCPLQILAQCRVDFHTCMISLPPYFCSTPLGVLLTFTLF